MNKYFKKITGLSLAFILVFSLTEMPAYAQEATQTALGEVNNFGELISLLWAYGSNVLIALAIFFIVLGAFFYVASGGNEEKIEQGKQMIFGSIIAIVIVMLSGVLIRVLHKPAEGSTGALADVPNVIGNATNLLIGLIGAFTILMISYSALLYLTGRGDEEKIQKAQNSLRYAVYGLVIGTLSYAMVNTVLNFLN